MNAHSGMDAPSGINARSVTSPPTDGVRARAYAPATVGNVLCGFDVFGLALEHPGDVVEARRRSEPGVVIAGIHGDGGRLPLDPTQNVIGVAAEAVI